MGAERVNVDNFVRAESNRMFAAMARDAGGVGRWVHFRELTPLDHQNVIRQNRDTLYSVAVVDITLDATLVVPDAAGRYLSVMVVNQDHYVDRILHEPGEYRLTQAEFGTPYVLVGARILVDPAEPDDVAAVHALQDGLQLGAGSNESFVLPEYDDAGLTSTRAALLELARGIDGFDRSFGAKDEVDPVRHLIATAAGWGGLPAREAYYVNVDPGLPVGEYRLTVRDVPVDGFWSLSVYNADGYFEANPRGVNTVNNLTATPNDDGSITINFGNGDEDKPNYLPIMEGWNYLVRFYRPRPEILDGSWTFPSLTEPGSTSPRS
jgi:hypothetical protein